MHSIPGVAGQVITDSAQLDMFAGSDEGALTVLSYGAGQDSSTILEKIIFDDSFRDKYVVGRLVVVMSDTGDEFPETYAHVEQTIRKCQTHGIEMHFLTSDKGFHSDGWKNLRHFYRSNDAIGSKSYPKTCTSRLKLEPIYRWLESWLSEQYGVRTGRKAGIREFAASNGKIRMIIGIAKGEERRMQDAKSNPKRWYRDSIENVYPLVEEGMDRAACQEYLHSRNMYVIPSNCMACPFMSLEELEYLRRFHPDSLSDLVQLEANKLLKHKDKESIIVTDDDGDPVLNRNGEVKTVNKNYGVWGVVRLPEKIKEAAIKLSDWSDDDIKGYRYSHGHCVANVF
jgi:hypothetical protein